MEYFLYKYHLKDQSTFEELMPCDRAPIWGNLAFTALLENLTVKSYERNKLAKNFQMSLNIETKIKTTSLHSGKIILFIETI
jgi:hypothetical protein